VRFSALRIYSDPPPTIRSEPGATGTAGTTGAVVLPFWMTVKTRVPMLTAPTREPPVFGDTV
jgi:hypothetical protein